MGRVTLFCFSDSLLNHRASLVAQNPPANAGDARHMGSIPGSGRSSGEENDNLLQYFLPGKFHGESSLEGYRTWGPKSWTWLSTHVHRMGGWVVKMKITVMIIRIRAPLH